MPLLLVILIAKESSHDAFYQVVVEDSSFVGYESFLSLLLYLKRLFTFLMDIILHKRPGQIFKKFIKTFDSHFSSYVPSLSILIMIESRAGHNG